MGENGSTNVLDKSKTVPVDKLLYMQLAYAVKHMTVPTKTALQLFINV
jgi:hypothetical protein